jgi:hypothetical protein
VRRHQKSKSAGYAVIIHLRPIHDFREKRIPMGGERRPRVSIEHVSYRIVRFVPFRLNQNEGNVNRYIYNSL